MKNTNVNSKDNELISILDTQFKGKVNLARVKLVKEYVFANAISRTKKEPNGG